MKRNFVALSAIGWVLITTTTLAASQSTASVRSEKPGPFRPGETITFNVKLNAPMPRGAHFAFRISPVSIDDEIDLGSGQPVNASRTEFRVSGKLPKSAMPGKWHISVIWLFLPGASWTHNTISANNVTFEVKGKPYPIPTTAQVRIAH